jgi:hypothetical protein
MLVRGTDDLESLLGLLSPPWVQGVPIRVPEQGQLPVGAPRLGGRGAGSQAEDLERLGRRHAVALLNPQ